MSPIIYNLAGTQDGQEFLTVFLPSQGALKAIASDHPNYDKVLDLCRNGGDLAEVERLADVAQTVARAFQRLSERVTVENGHVCFDGDQAEFGLENQIIRFLDEGVDVSPLVAFAENMAANPVEHSRRQAWDWLNNHEFTITDDGHVLAYKGVYADGNGGYRSGSRGHAFVNDVEIRGGYVPNAVGDVVTMPRSEVAHDPSVACHTGLHVGTYAYAQSYARGAMLLVKVNPRDIVSVPTDAAGEKIRVCRYEVLEIIDAPESAPLYTKMSWAEFTDDDSADIDLDLDALDEEVREIEEEITDLEDDLASDRYDGDVRVEIQDDLEDARKRLAAAQTKRDRHPAQDDKGRFSAGRPGSKRGPNGQFIPEA